MFLFYSMTLLVCNKDIDFLNNFSKMEIIKVIESYIKNNENEDSV